MTRDRELNYNDDAAAEPAVNLQKESWNMTGFEYLSKQNGGVRRDGDNRRIRRADDYPSEIGLTIFRVDEDPVAAAIIEAKMSGRVMEIFTRAEPDRFPSQYRHIPAEHLNRLGEVRDGQPVELEPANGNEPFAIDPNIFEK